MRRSILIVAGAAALALVIFLIVLRFLARGPEQAGSAQPQVVRLAADSVLVAAKDLPAGTAIKIEDVRWQRWPEEALDPSFFIQEKGADPQKVAVGWVVLHGFEAGEPLTAQRLMKPGDTSFLSAELAPGMRAETISLSTTSGEAGFLLPGDHVDVLLRESFSVKPSQSAVDAETNLPEVLDNRYVVSVVLRDVKVLAVNAVTDDMDVKNINAPASTATLEVNLAQAEKLELVQSLPSSSLSLVLRSHALPRLPEPADAGTTVEDFESDPYRASVIENIKSTMGTSDNIYHGTRGTGMSGE